VSSRISAARYSSTAIRYTKKRKKKMGNNTLFLVITSSITSELENLFSTAVRYMYPKKRERMR
jgi:hypothetical protein